MSSLSTRLKTLLAAASLSFAALAAATDSVAPAPAPTVMEEPPALAVGAAAALDCSNYTYASAPGCTTTPCCAPSSKSCGGSPACVLKPYQGKVNQCQYVCKQN